MIEVPAAEEARRRVSSRRKSEAERGNTIRVQDREAALRHAGQRFGNDFGIE